jgi:hypothetical protein
VRRCRTSSYCASAAYAQKRIPWLPTLSASALSTPRVWSDRRNPDLGGWPRRGVRWQDRSRSPDRVPGCLHDRSPPTAPGHARRRTTSLGPAYAAGNWLFVWENGQRPHPDTVTGTFNRLVDTASSRRIRLHDVRHTHSTLSTPASNPRSSVIEWSLQPSRHVPDLRPSLHRTGPRRRGTHRSPDRGGRQRFGGHHPRGRLTGCYYRSYYENRENGPREGIPRAVSPGSGGGIRTRDLWVMSGHAAVSHSPTHTADVPCDQRPGAATVSALPLSPAA